MLALRKQEYDETRLVLRGEASIRPMYQELATWMESQWAVAVLNVTTAANDSPERHPAVWLLREEDVRLLRDDPDNLSAIVQKFRELVQAWKTQGFDAQHVRVDFAAFVPLAVEDSVARLTDAAIDDLKKQAANPDLWAIARSWGRIFFLFATEDLGRSHEASGLKSVYRGACFEILKPYDEFGLFHESDISVEFGSKEEVDSHFRGSLSYYEYYK